MMEPELKQAARLVLEHAARASRAPRADWQADLASGPVFVIRSGGTDMLASFLRRLASVKADGEVFVLGRRGDRDLIPRLWTGAWACHEVGHDEPFSWRDAASEPHVRVAAERCGAHVFLMRNASATGYDNIIEILRGLAPNASFFGWTADDTLVRFDPQSTDRRLASARLRDALVDWAAHMEGPSAR